MRSSPERGAVSRVAGLSCDAPRPCRGRVPPGFLAIDPPAAKRNGDDLDLAVDLELPQGVLNVISDRRVGQIQTRRDVEGCVPIAEDRDNLLLSLRKGAGAGRGIQNVNRPLGARHGARDPEDGRTRERVHGFAREHRAQFGPQRVLLPDAEQPLGGRVQEDHATLSVGRDRGRLFGGRGFRRANGAVVRFHVTWNFSRRISCLRVPDPIPGPPLDVVVLGAGQAGLPLAHALAKAGKRVAIAERKDLGGSCANFGCTPTKAVIASARAAYLARRAAVFGLRVPKVEIDFPAVLDRARSILMYSRAGIRRNFEESDNPRLVRGRARLEGREGRLFKVRIGKESLRARQVVLDTGTRSDLGSIRGLSSVPFLHASNWLDQNELPRHILFVGGGYIALEMGQLDRRMGSRVTVVDGGDQILKTEDRDIAERLQHLLESEGIQFRLNCHVTRVSPRRSGLAAIVEKGCAREVFAASHFFVSAARRANTDDLGLETVGLKPGAHGILAVDERLATSVPGIWAAGDIRGGPMFTHTSWDDHRILLSQLVGDGKRTTRRIVPYAVYTDPELRRRGAAQPPPALVRPPHPPPAAGGRGEPPAAAHRPLCRLPRPGARSRRRARAPDRCR